jgi:hypothetical protein
MDAPGQRVLRDQRAGRIAGGDLDDDIGRNREKARRSAMGATSGSTVRARFASRTRIATSSKSGSPSSLAASA